MIETNFQTENDILSNYEIIDIGTEDVILQEKNVLNLISEYMEGDLKESEEDHKITDCEKKYYKLEDLSYEWVLKDTNVQIINKSIKSDLMNLKSLALDRRDLTCELKVF